MKTSFLVAAFIGALAITSQPSIAQKSFTEGKIVYEISYPDMEMDPQIAAVMPTEQVVFVKGNMSRSEMSMGMGMSSSTIMNGKTGEMISLTDIMGTKSAVRLSAEDMKKAAGQTKESKAKVNITSETKEIAGYPCKKAVVTTEGGGVIDIYFTEKIASKLAGMGDYEEIKGFPLEYAVEQSGIKMKFSAKAVTAQKVADDMFQIPSDYKVMTQEEMMKQFGGAGQ